MKLRVLLGSVLLIVVGGCAGTLPVQTQIVNNQAIQADFETTWDAVIQWFALTNNPIATIEKASGIIATEQLTDAIGALNCGEAGYGYAYRTPEVRMNVFVRSVTPEATEVRVTMTGRVMRVGNIGATSGQAEWRTCYSNGSFERDMLESVSEAVSREDR